jgi:hypothetical protein
MSVRVAMHTNLKASRKLRYVYGSACPSCVIFSRYTTSLSFPPFCSFLQEDIFFLVPLPLPSSLSLLVSVLFIIFVLLFSRVGYPSVQS